VSTYLRVRGQEVHVERPTRRMLKAEIQAALDVAEGRAITRKVKAFVVEAYAAGTGRTP
jgi:hypothetical protein